MATDPRFVTNQNRMANREELVALLTERLQTRTTDEWMALFDVAGLPAVRCWRFPMRWPIRKRWRGT